MDIYYTSAEARPVALYINGDLVQSKALAATTGTATPDTWSAEGVFTFCSGRNTIRLERPGRFYPATDQFRLTPATGAEAQWPQTPHQIARRFELNPEFFDQWAAYLRRTAQDENNPLRAWHLAAGDDRRRIAEQLGEEFAQAAEAQSPTPRQQLLRQVIDDKFSPFAVPGNASRFYPPQTAARVKSIEAETKELEAATPRCGRPSHPPSRQPSDAQRRSLTPLPQSHFRRPAARAAAQRQRSP